MMNWIGSTIIVLVLVTAFALYLGVIDFGLSQLASIYLKRYGSVIGQVRIRVR